jgi:hypothetical protein
LRELKDLKLKQQPLISAFAAAYQNLIENLIDASILFGKMEQMDAEIQRHHATRPAGVARSSTA